MAALDQKQLIQAALDAGAAKAMLIPQEKLALSASFRDLCAANACGKYGRFYTCPPHVGEVEALMAELGQFGNVLVYQTIASLEDSFDFEGMEAAGKAHGEVGQRLQTALKAGLPRGFLHLAGGGCRLCERCTMPDALPCRFPERMLPSLSGYGIDVYSTVKDSELKYINGQNTVTYFGMVFLDPKEQ